MTIVAAWVRTSKRGAEELIVCSDSRLNGGGILDCAPKTFQLPRKDSVLAFSGDTFLAYPLLLQMSQAINSHTPMRDGVIDYIPFRTYTVKLLNTLFSSFETYIEEFKQPNYDFLLCGYSWFRKEFCIDRLVFMPNSKRFEVHSVQKGIGEFGKIAFIGDKSREARDNLYTLLRTRHGDTSVIKGAPFLKRYDMEPFEVIRDMLRTADMNSTIGGAPQLLSICQHMTSRHLAIHWPNKNNGKVFLSGRPVFDFENIDSWILDPDTFQKTHKHLTRHDNGN
jgi:hypothetical protein